MAACSMSPEEERALGASYAEQLDAQLTFVSDSALARYVRSLGERLARTADSSSRVWRFAVVDDTTVNAFAVPGGYIYVNRGLIDRAETMAELAGVLGHEIGHVQLRHSAEQMEQRTKTNVVVTLFCQVTGWCASEVAQVAISVGGAALFARHSRNDEATADSVAVEYLHDAGIDPRAVSTMFSRLLELRRGAPDALSSFFASHPLEEERVRRTSALAGRYPAGELDALQLQDEEFVALRATTSSTPD
jgi:beta-barrel assembly-enhancing protease